MFYNDKKFIGSKIKQARIKAKLSQGQLAEKIELSEKHISNIERGLNMPALDSFFKICNVLNLSLSDFGVDTKQTPNELQNDMLNKVFSASEKELIAYNALINTFKSAVEEFKK